MARILRICGPRERGNRPPAGIPPQMGGGPRPRITAPEQARSFVDARIAEGSAYSRAFHALNYGAPCRL